MASARLGLPSLLVLGALLAVAATGQAAGGLEDPVPWGVEAVYNASSLERTSGGDGVDVAVLDTGVDRDHPDLRGQVERCRNYTARQVQVGSCGDVSGHGTHVAGTVAADGGPEGKGLWGVAPGADVWAFKVCRDDGACATDRVGQAIRDAAGLGAEVVVLSLGGQPDPFVQPALKEARRQDALVVAASGNAGPNLTTIKYPAADRLAVAVAAVGRVQRGGGHDVGNLAVPDFSSRGAPADAFAGRDNLTEVAAPGLGVRSTLPGGRYGHLGGTSMAAPHVGGLAAVLWDLVGDADGDGRTRDDVRLELRERARGADVVRGTHAGPGYDPAAGVGLPRLAGLEARIDGPMDPVLAGTNVTLRAQAAGPVPVVDHAWDLDGDGRFEARGTNVSRTFQAAGPWNATLRVTDDRGARATARYRVRVHHLPIPRFRADPTVSLSGSRFVLDGTGSFDPDGGPIASYRWDIDGDLVADRSGPRVNVSVPKPGPVEVTLSVEDDEGALNGTTGSVLINDRPRVRLNLPASASAGDPIRLEAQVADRYGSVNVTWHLSGDRRLSGNPVETTFPAGDHPVRVVATDDHGASGSAEATLRVVEAPLGLPTPAPGASAALAAAAVAAGLAGARRRR